MCLCKAKHHHAFGVGHVEHDAADEGCYVLGECAGYDHDDDYYDGFFLLEERGYIDEHAYADEEVGDKECVAHKLYSVHQG